MRWATLSHVHLDRVASPWLITRFVDTEAEFEFIDWGPDGRRPNSASLVIPVGATPIGVPGAELGMHDEQGSCFAKITRKYELDDPALRRMERIIASGISHALDTPPPSNQSDEERDLGAALNLLGESFGILYDDSEHLVRATVVYDAIYLRCRLAELPPNARKQVPTAPPLRIPYLREALALASGPPVVPGPGTAASFA